MTGFKSSLLVVFVGLCGAVILFVYLRPYAPQTAIDLCYSRSETIRLAEAYLDSLGYDASGLYSDANLDFDSGTTHYLETVLGLAKAHQLLRRDSLLTHHWEVYFFDPKVPPSQMHDQFRVRISPTGKVLSFQHIIQDSISLPFVDMETAKSLAERFLRDAGHNLTKLRLENSTVNERIARRDFAFQWISREPSYGLTTRVSVDIHGDRIGNYRVQLEEPENYRKKFSGTQTMVNYVFSGSAMATFAVLVFTIALFLKKYHDGEVGVKTAIHIFGLLFGVTILDYALRFTTIGNNITMGDVNRFNVRIIVFIMTVFLVQAFMSAMVFAGWSVGESSARRGWSRKLKAIDGLYYGKPFTLELANAILSGYGFGLALLGAILAFLVLASKYSNVSLFAVNLTGVAESKAPALSAVLLALRIALLNEIVFRFFFIAWLREKTRHVWQGLLISSLLWTILAFTLWDFPFGYLPFQFLFPAYFVLSLLFGLIVIRYDLLTAIVTNFVILAVPFAIPVLTASAEFFQTQSWIFYLVMVAPLGLAAMGYIKQQKFKFSLELTPTHIKRISERERMSRELEIARSVQMSLLPKQNPLIEGYDIAGVCIPALEVGGDYYDFFQLGDSKIGIAIGDVSGKGVPAAIYMTLTKGILQSHATESISPREVLIKLNRQMYSNIERNSFVSMFYAVLDMKKHMIRFSRAGHNPAILAQRSTNRSTLVQPAGIALGLEAGERFQTCLEEHELPLQSGDVLTFYTDGFTEASNEVGEEFGEDRLERRVSDNKDHSASIIIQRVVRTVKTFVGNHPQHDDMTMVVIKVL